MGVDQYRLGTRGYGTHQAVLDLVQPGACLLDVGAAGGYLSELAQDIRGASVLAVEPDAAGCAECRERGVDVLEGGVAELLATGDLPGRAPFDQLLLADVLEHMPDPYPVLVQLVALLRPGGTAIVSVPNIAYIRARLRLLSGKWRYEDTGIFDRTHLRFFDHRGIVDLLQASGLDVDHEIPIGPGSYALGRPGIRITRLRPSLLASQFVLLGRRPTT